MIYVHLLLIVLYSIEVLAVAGMLAIGADYVAYEIRGMIKRDRLWVRTARRLIAESRVASENVKKLIAESNEAMRKSQLRARKEAEAAAEFFGAEYFCGFDRTGALIYRGATAPAGQDWEFFQQKQDEIADSAIFTLTEDV